MNYIELKCQARRGQDKEAIIATLAEIGFESFVEEGNDVLAYIQEADFSQEAIDNMKLEDEIKENTIFSHKLIEDQNWNAVWESNYDPVLIDGKCHIRAPFHEKRSDVEYEIEIEPQMSFGTAHHETTSLMISQLMEENIKGKTVLDMGCGTAVLAILASMRGAIRLDAIDIDEWAYKNTLENIERNQITNIKAEEGGAELLAGREYELIIANINRNILLNDMKAYVGSLKKGGRILFSGFYTEDILAIRQEAESLGLTYKSHREKNNWVVVAFSY